jgi:formate dehydrogenase maturation protein FdhE
MKCKNCGSEEFYILDDTESGETIDIKTEIWKCMKCKTYYKIKYKMFSIVELKRAD